MNDLLHRNSPGRALLNALDKDIEQARKFMVLDGALAVYGAGYALIESINLWATGNNWYFAWIGVGVFVCSANIWTLIRWRELRQKRRALKQSVITVLTAKTRTALECAIDQQAAMMRDVLGKR